jgi:hypothetical protein
MVAFKGVDMAADESVRDWDDDEDEVEADTRVVTACVGGVACFFPLSSVGHSSEICCKRVAEDEDGSEQEDDEGEDDNEDEASCFSRLRMRVSAV